nr:RHS repeat-associated core domain-containing protein [Pectobacterium polonicum]
MSHKPCTDPGLAFAGQYRGSESGLCYKSFRFYDPTGEYYVSPDPIGLAGSIRHQGYAFNLLEWGVPLGL